MRRPTHLLLATSLLLAACTATGPGRPLTPSDPDRKVTSPKPSAHGSGAPVPAPVQLLKAPAGAATRLAGRITLDAGYLLAQGAASLIGNDGSTVIARDGASVIARDGAGLAPASGNAVIARDGAGLIGDDGGAPASGSGNRVALDGSGVIARDGAGVIARDGAGVIARDGAGVIARDGASYHLAQAAASLPAGSERPVGAMQLRIFSLTTNRPLTLGVDAAGQPVDAIYTNAEGRFEVFLPADVGDRNVHVVAAAKLPGAEALRYDLIAPTSREAELDEDTQLITSYMLEIYVGRLRYLFERGPDKAGRAFGILPGANIPTAQARIAEFQAKIAGTSPAERDRRFAAAARLLLAAPQTSIFDVRPLEEEGFYTPERLARIQALYPDATGFEILRDVLKRVRRAVAARLAQVADNHPDARYRANPLAYLDELPVVAEYRRLRNGSALAPKAPEFHVTNTTDFNLFMIRAYLGNDLTGCVGPCDPFDLSNDTLPELAKYDGIARLLEGSAPARGPEYVANNLRGLFIQAPSPDLPPRLSAMYAGADALPAGTALPQDVTWGLAYGARAISMRLLLTLMFTPRESLDAGTVALLDELGGIFEGR